MSIISKLRTFGMYAAGTEINSDTGHHNALRWTLLTEWKLSKAFLYLVLVYLDVRINNAILHWSGTEMV
jgi:hypothetical protein